MTQEDFSAVSSRTYLSSLERGQKSPTLDKIDVLSQTIGIHFLSLLTLTCMYSGKMDDVESLLERIRTEVMNMDMQSCGPLEQDDAADAAQCEA